MHRGAGSDLPKHSLESKQTYVRSRSDTVYAIHWASSKTLAGVKVNVRPLSLTYSICYILSVFEKVYRDVRTFLTNEHRRTKLCAFDSSEYTSTTIFYKGCVVHTVYKRQRRRTVLTQTGINKKQANTIRSTYCVIQTVVRRSNLNLVEWTKIG